MKVSGGARHYLPRKASLKLCYVMLWLYYVMVILGYVQLYKVIIFHYAKVKSFTLKFFFPDCHIWPIFAYNNEHRLKLSQVC